MAKLTEQEQQEVIRFIEAGRPLPDKYRFLLFDDKREVELVWNGKTNEVTNVVLPFQVIEQVDEPRAEKPEDLALQAGLFDERGRQLKGWTNKLIWGDNKLILSSLKNGPLRDEIEAQGGLKLIYIDPPFDAGADFSMDLEIGDNTFTKKPSILEEIAYRDTWGRGTDSFISMLYERLRLMYGLLAESGTIFVHCDWRVNSCIRLILDEVFTKDFELNEVIWKRSDAHSNSNYLGINTDTLFIYSKNGNPKWNKQYQPYSEDYVTNQYRYVEEGTGRRYLSRSCTGFSGINRPYSWKGITKPWRYSPETFARLEDEGRIVYTSNGTPRYKQYLDEMPGTPLSSLWDDIGRIHHLADERID